MYRVRDQLLRLRSGDTSAGGQKVRPRRELGLVGFSLIILSGEPLLALLSPEFVALSPSSRSIPPDN
ncbi:hypothetical protein J6590_059629 [Homalodisca vitripennis]|nr:hypothetical protein J6590_059629 [Homalodisca vitripennis]